MSDGQSRKTNFVSWSIYFSGRTQVNAILWTSGELEANSKILGTSTCSFYNFTHIQNKIKTFLDILFQCIIFAHYEPCKRFLQGLGTPKSSSARVWPDICSSHIITPYFYRIHLQIRDSKELHIWYKCPTYQGKWSVNLSYNLSIFCNIVFKMAFYCQSHIFGQYHIMSRCNVNWRLYQQSKSYQCQNIFSSVFCPLYSFGRPSVFVAKSIVATS